MAVTFIPICVRAQVLLYEPDGQTHLGPSEKVGDHRLCHPTESFEVYRRTAGPNKGASLANLNIISPPIVLVRP